ncbi:hypothetical protein [Arthrobacter oryzae]|jgi:hypothetical protein|nr:hypothetical protein [Arthrobacter oryzae]MDQ0079409.1 hypothetical protein [Arthrobacter oryzae]
MTETLKAGGAEIVSKPMAFSVKGSEGPLRSGELEKAAASAGDLLKRAGR